MSRFWFGQQLPSEFDDPAVRDLLSFNGQLHFRCGACDEVTWSDITFGKELIKSGTGFPCPNCRAQHLEVVRFNAIEYRTCKGCAAQSFASPADDFQCTVCQARGYNADNTTISPEYPMVLFALYGRDIPFGQSPSGDTKFIMEYVRGLRMSPQFHQSCIHLVAFIESLFKHVYGSAAHASELLNAASALMRTVYKETGDRDAAYLSIVIMMEARDLSHDQIRRAVYGLNINQNIYSVLARGDDAVLKLRFKMDLKAYGIWLSRKTLAAFEALNEDRLAQLRARQKWLLGDILKAGTPSEAEIDEALGWFNAALQDPALPPDVTDFVRESAHAAQAKRRHLTPEQRREIESNLAEIAERNLDQSDGLQRIKGLSDLLRGAGRLNDCERRRELARRCFGEAILYTAANDPRNMLRHAGTVLAQLVAGYAAERFASGEPLAGIAAVEAFRSLAIEQGNMPADLGHHVHELEVRLMTKALIGGEPEDPTAIADSLLAKYREILQDDLRNLLSGETPQVVVWCDVWDGALLTAKIERRADELVVDSDTTAFSDTDVGKAMTLPMADAPPGRLRSRRITTALKSGWPLFASVFENVSSTVGTIFVGPSFFGSWPVDAAEAVHTPNLSALRPVTFTPTLRVAASARQNAGNRSIAQVLVVSYGGSDLPGTRQEIEDIKSAYASGVTILDGGTIDKAAVLNALSEPYDVIHFCGHGEFDYLDPLKSRIYFDGDRGDDGLVSAADILRCGTIGRDPVVVLSACTSALVLPNASNNFLGLAGALLRTGAIAIVGARWPISDHIAATFATHFHTQLASGASVAESVAFAKTLLRDTRVGEWSAYMHIGA